MNKQLWRAAAGKTAVILLLSVFAALTLAALPMKSATFDEGNHLARGLYPLAGKGFLLNREHPPLVNLLQALPVHWTMRPHMPEATPEMYPFFAHSAALLWHSGNDGAQMIHLARVVTIVLSLILGALLFIWARELHGPAGGVIALALFVFSPLTLAHGALATTDMGLALFLFVFLFAFWKFLQAPAWPRLAVSGLCLGAAVGSKHMALLVLPGVALALAAAAPGLRALLPGEADGGARRNLTAAALAFGVMCALAFGVLLALYGGGAEFPYFAGLRQGWRFLGEGRVYYLDGGVSSDGWLSYFPLAFWYKTPLPGVLLLAWALWLYLSRQAACSREMRFVAAAVAVMALAVAAKKTDLGLRYILFAHPFLYLGAGALARAPRGRALLAPLLLWLAVDVLAAFPHYLSYFNRVIAPEEKRWHLVDSNLDWGQDLPALAEFQRRHNVRRLKLGYFGTADPAAYGVAAQPLPSFLAFGRQAADGEKLEGMVAVSATLLQGLYNRPPDFYAALRRQKPVAELGGGAILIFNLSP